MSRAQNRQVVEKLLNLAGITVDGSNPWDIQIRDPALFEREIIDPALWFGETYMDNLWECARIDELIYRILSANLLSKKSILSRLPISALINYFLYLPARLFNLQTQRRAFIVGREHYDLGNDLYECMLDKRMIYSCGYWKEAETLDAAQEAKLDLSCRKLQLKPGMRVLDIGCGFGGFARFAAERYGVSVVGVTISEKQQELALLRCQGLPIEIRLEDYRNLNESFDRIASFGMFEHVGYKNYRTFMEVAYRCLKEDGLFLLHTIGSNYTTTHANRFISKYIFPNGMLPSIAQIGQALENIFIAEDCHNFGPDYDATLLAWYENFNRHWDKLQTRYSARMRRMWNYYLLSCAGSFRARDMQVWQWILTKHNGRKGRYNRVT